MNLNESTSIALPRVGTLLVALLVIAAEVMTALGGTASYGSPFPIVVGFALLTAVSSWVIFAPGQRLPMAPAVVAAIAPTVAAVIASSTIVAHDGDALWHLGYTALLLLLVGLRGRLLLAWIGMAGAAVTTLIWAALGHFVLLTALGILLRQVAILVLGTLFIAAVGQLQRRLISISDRSARLTAQELADAAGADARRQRLEWARSLAAPLLEKIAASDELDEAVRLDAALIEAELRDGLRAPTLAAEPVTSAARRARARDVEVILLDDRRLPLADEHAEEIRARVAQELTATSSGRFVARLAPEGRTPLATILVDGPEGRRIELN